MNPLANIWQHPKTSLAGMLIAAATIAGVLGQQGVTLGSMGNGTVVSFVGALSAALLGLLARDPERKQESKNDSKTSESNGTTKLAAWMLVALLLSGTMPTVGCSGQNAAQQIVNWTPSLQSAVAAVDSLGASLSPQDAEVFAAITASFNAASNLLVAQAKAYLADPSGNTLHLLQDQVVVLQQQVNVALLAVAKIANPNSQQRVLVAVQAVATIATAILSLVQSVSSQNDVQRMAAQSTVKTAAVEPLLNPQAAAELVAEHYAEPLPVAERQVAQARVELAQAGL